MFLFGASPTVGMIEFPPFLSALRVSGRTSAFPLPLPFLYRKVLLAVRPFVYLNKSPSYFCFVKIVDGYIAIPYFPVSR
jgi:hypothetical protein